MFTHAKHELDKLGPGVVTGAADDDPSGIATYSQAGAQYGYTTLWCVFFTIPLMIAVQEMCARIALVTKKGLVANLRSKYGRPLVIAVVLLLLIANTVNLGADLGMMASATQLLWPVSFVGALITIALFTLLLQIFTSYRTYAKYLKWLTLSLFAYVLVAFSVHVDWVQAFTSTLVPHIRWTRDYLMLFVGLLGTTISPYLFFWQANQEVEEDGDGGKMYRNCGDCVKDKIRAMRFDVNTGMVFSNIMSWFIILATAAVLFSAGGTVIQSADEAARVLRPIAGSFASVLFTIGIIGTGLLAVPIFSSTAAYALTELFGMKEGLSSKWNQAKIFYGIVIVSTVVGGLMNVLGISPVRALIYAAVVNGIAAPPLIYFIMRLGSDKKIMGEHANKKWSLIFGWLAFGFMAAAVLVWAVVSLIK